MSAAIPTDARLDDHTHGAHERYVHVTIEGVEYRFVRLRWRERNRVVHGAVGIDAGGLEMRPIEFAEDLLAASLESVIRDHTSQPVTPEWLDSVPVRLGDRLLEAALRSNRRQMLDVDETVTADHSISVRVNSVVYTLATWTWGMRNRLLDRISRTDPADDTALDAARFHEQVLATSCVAIDGREPPASWLDDLDADVGDAVLDSALKRCGLDREEERELVQALHAGRPHNAITLYTLCREFGWTPEQARSQHATDIDALLAVHRTMQRPANASTVAVQESEHTMPAPSWSGDETVIMVADDDPSSAMQPTTDSGVTS